MTRPLRIQFEGAWYHVMNRGSCREPIFRSDRQRQLFLELLAELVKMHKIEIHAYCLMDNHYHLLVRTLLPNISKAMQYLSSLYTVRYNKLEGTDGPLFRGRFKSKLVDSESYGLHLVRYIHLNPLAAGMVNDIESYRWSSYRAYLGLVEKPVWLTLSDTLKYFCEDNYFNKFRLFTLAGNPETIEKFFSGSKEPPIIGSDEFINKIKLEFRYSELSHEVIERKFLRPTLDQILTAVSDAFKIAPIQIMRTSRSSVNHARIMTMFIAKNYFCYKLIEIAEFFGVDSYQTISKLTLWQSKEIPHDTYLMSRLTEVIALLQADSSGRKIE